MKYFHLKKVIRGAIVFYILLPSQKRKALRKGQGHQI